MGGTLYTDTKGNPVLYVQDQEKFNMKEWDQWIEQLHRSLNRDKNIFRKTILKIKPNGKRKI